MKKLFIFLLIGVFLLSFISAACQDGDGYLGDKEPNTCVRISQTCASCTYVNISSVTLSTINETLITNVSMSNLGNSEWVYQFCNTSQFGSYFVVGEGNIGGTNTIFRSCFDIGQNLNTGESFIYGIFLFILFGLLFIMFYFIIIMPKENPTNDDGFIIEIIKMKYIRALLIGIIYPLIIVILNLMNGLAVRFATSSIFAGTLGFLFETMLRMAWTYTVIIILWIIYMLIKDSNVKKSIEKLGRYRLNG